VETIDAGLETLQTLVAGNIEAVTVDDWHFYLNEEGKIMQLAPNRRAAQLVLEETAIHWLQTNFLKTELELGHCLRLPAEGPCESGLMLSCPKFLTTSEYAPRLRARLDREEQLIADAEVRGWPREMECHQATQHRISQTAPGPGIKCRAELGMLGLMLACVQGLFSESSMISGSASWRFIRNNMLLSFY